MNQRAKSKRESEGESDSFKGGRPQRDTGKLYHTSGRTSHHTSKYDMMAHMKKFNTTSLLLFVCAYHTYDIQSNPFRPKLNKKREKSSDSFAQQANAAKRKQKINGNEQDQSLSSDILKRKKPGSKICACIYMYKRCTTPTTQHINHELHIIAAREDIRRPSITVPH